MAMKQALIDANDTLRDLFPGGEHGRNLVHALGTAFPALLVLPGVEWMHVTLLIVLVTVAVVALEVLRLRMGVWLFLHDLLLREYEQDAPAAYMLYMAGMTIVAVVFEPHIAIPAILMLTLADPFAGVVSDDELRRVKRLMSLAVMFGLCALLALPFAYEEPLAVLLGATGGMLADGVKLSVGGFVLDDDLTVAPMGAFGLWLGTNLDALSVVAGSLG